MSIFNRIRQYISVYNTNQNTQQYITLASSFVSEYISISIATLAIWFIPQDKSYSYDIIQYLFVQDWHDILIILSNLIAYICFNVLYLYEIYREIWLIRHFDYSTRYHSMNLSRYKSDYPEIFTSLATINWFYYKIYTYMRLVITYNIIITILLIIKYNYGDYKTITTLFTNFWICYNKILSGLKIARDSSKKNIGYAYFNTQNISFNRIDPKIKRHNSNSLQNSHVNSPTHSRMNSSIDLRSINNIDNNNYINNYNNDNNDNNIETENIETENISRYVSRKKTISLQNSINGLSGLSGLSRLSDISPNGSIMGSPIGSYSGSNLDSLNASINVSINIKDNICNDLGNDLGHDSREIDMMQEPDMAL